MTRGDLVISADFGTSGVKVGVVDSSLTVLARVTESYPLVLKSGGIAEQSPEDWWAALAHALASLRQELPDLSKRTAALVFSSQLCGVICADANGTPLRPCLTWLDKRAAPLGKKLTGGFPEVHGYNLPRLLKWLRLANGAPAKNGMDPTAKMLWVMQQEPEIYEAIRRDALLENVTVDDNGKIDYDDISKTENTRVSYPIHHIDNIVKPISMAGHASKVIFLTADAFGVMPPVSKLTAEQAEYYFLSGFTAKLAGTERGITEPTPTFSPCFGGAFLSLHPTTYAKVLGKRMEAVKAEAYLVNTGWNGTGKRISIKDTRAIIDAILNDSIDQGEFETVPYFNLATPTQVEGVDSKLLNPQGSYANVDEWDEKARDLAKRFINNFAQFTDTERGKALVAVGPKL